MEIKFTREVCKGWRARGAYVFAVVGGERQISGLPDRVLWFRGKTIWVEFKGPNGTLRTNQRLIIKEAWKHDVHCAIVWMDDMNSVTLQTKNGYIPLTKKELIDEIEWRV